MLTLTNIGSFMAVLFRFLYKNLVCGILCRRCRCCRKPAIRHNDVDSIQNDVTTPHDHIIAVETRDDVEECYEYACAVVAGSEDRDCSNETVRGKTGLDSCKMEETVVEDDGGVCRTESESRGWRILGKRSRKKRISDGGVEVETPPYSVDACIDDGDCLRCPPDDLPERIRRSQEELAFHTRTKGELTEMELDRQSFPARNRAHPESSSIETDTDEPEEEDALGASESSRMMLEAKLVGDPERLTSASVRSVTLDRRVVTRPLTVVKHRFMKWRRGFQIVLYAHYQ